MKAKRAFHWLDPRSASTRVILAVLIGAVAWLIVPAKMPYPIRILLAWNSAALSLFAIAAVIIVHADSEETRRRAAAFDPGRFLVWVIVLAASAVSLFASIVVLRERNELRGAESTLLLGLCTLTIATSWLLTHTGFALRYAHLYYRAGREDEGGMDFPGEDPDEPDDLDFVYFAFTIGMCFQTSDVSITDRTIRRTVLLHSMLSYLYSTGILAFSINVVAGQLAGPS